MNDSSPPAPEDTAPGDTVGGDRVVVGDDSRMREVRGTRDARAADLAHARGDTVQRPAVRPADHPGEADRALGGADDGDQDVDDGEQKSVGEALAGFFAGMVYILVLPVLWWVLSDPDSPMDLLSADLVFFLPAIVVPVGLAIVPRTRRFGRYMLLGAGLSGIVVVGVAALVLAFLIFTGR